jgi:hypothetical protein
MQEIKNFNDAAVNTSVETFEEIQKEISRIQFHTNLDQKTKNKMMVGLEKKLEALQN